MLEQIIFLKQLEAKLEILEARQLEQWHAIKVMRDELAKQMTRMTESIAIETEEPFVQQEEPVSKEALLQAAVTIQEEVKSELAPIANEEQVVMPPISIPNEEAIIKEEIQQTPKAETPIQVAVPANSQEETENIAATNPTVVNTEPMVTNSPSPANASINDQYNNKPSNLAEQLTLKPINDLKSAIGTNDRFLFIAQLFGGDANKFNQAITNLNHCANLDAALQHLHNNYKRAEWEQNHKTLEQLEIYLKRRYAGN